MAPTAGASSTVAAGTVTLLTDAPQSEAMLLGGISRSFEPPATLRLTQDAWRFTFPVSGGHLDPGTGTAGARGGLVLWGRETMSASLQLSFTKLTVTTGAHPALSGLYWLSGKRRHVLATLDMSRASVTSSNSGGHDWVTLAGVPATMTEWLGHQLTSALPRHKPSDRR